MRYRDLNAPPDRTMAQIVRGLRAGSEGLKTGDHGKKHMGLTGDQLWYRPDGTEHSVRDIDDELQGAQERIEDAEQSLIESGQRLDEAETTIASTAEDLTRVETVVIPGAVEALEQADAAAQQELATLDGKLVTAEGEITTAKENIGQLETDLAAESDAREQLATNVQGTFDDLDTRLDTFGDDEALAGLRQALSDAQATATSASQAAAAADQAASAASQAALEAAGIAASKGRVIIQDTEPTGDDRQAANIWIKPAVDDPDTEITETATTYVYLADSDEWIPTTSDELAQAAQNALDAREAAQQAQQRADTAISNAATAQSAAEAAQRTADEATTDAREAHNAAVEAQAAADAAKSAAVNLVGNGSFEKGLAGWQASATVSADTEQAHSGSQSALFSWESSSVTAEIIWPEPVPVSAGQVWEFSAWALYESGEGGGGGLRLQHSADGSSWTYVSVNFARTSGWRQYVHRYAVPEGVAFLRARIAHQPLDAPIWVDGVSLRDVTDAVALEAAAQTAQDRADEAYDEAAKKLDESQVDAKITASANGKNSITISTSAPSGDGVRPGDVWWRTDGNSDVFGQWGWNGSSWIPRQVTSEVIANLDVHKLRVTGDASMDSAVIDKLWVDGLVGKAAAFNRITVSSSVNLIPNGDLEHRSGEGWPGSGSYREVHGPPGLDRDSPNITWPAGTRNVPVRWGPYPVQGGGSLGFHAWFRTYKPASDSFVEVRYLDRSGTSTRLTGWAGTHTNGQGPIQTGTSGLGTDGWVEITASVDLPEDATHVTLSYFDFNRAGGADTDGQPMFGGIRLFQKVGAVTIADGAVGADQIRADEVGAEVGEFVEAEVGNLKATTGTVGEAVIDKLWTDGLVAKSIAAGSLIVADASVNEFRWVSDSGWNDWWTNRTYWTRSGSELSYDGGGSSSLDYRLMGGSYHPTTPGDVWQVSVDVTNRDPHPSEISIGGYLSAGGSYSSSLWPSEGGVTLGAGERKTFHVAVPVDEMAEDEEGFTPVIYFRNSNKSGGRAVTVHSVRVIRRTPVGATLIEPGAVTTEKLTVTEEMSAKIADFMSVETKKLVVTEDTLLNHATLIGQTVVDDINVQGKLIGSDGVFTGTVDFANINVTGEVLADKISGEYLYGTEIEGGVIYTSNTGSGQVTLSDTGYTDSANGDTHPGIRVVPPDTSGMATPPGIGARGKGMWLNAGRTAAGERAHVYLGEGRMYASGVQGSRYSDLWVADAFTRMTSTDGTGNTGQIIAGHKYAQVRTDGADGAYGVIEATHDYAVTATRDPAGNYMSQIRSNGREAYMWSTGSDGLGRILSVDSDGVWLKMERNDGSGLYDHYNLNPQRNSNPFPMPSGWVPDGSANAARYTITLGMCYWGGILKYSGTLSSGWTTIGTAPVEARPREGDQTRALPTSSGRTVLGKIHMSGRIQIWLDQSASGIFMHFAPFTYLV